MESTSRETPPPSAAMPKKQPDSLSSPKPVAGTASFAGQSTPDGDDTSGSNPLSSTNPKAASPSGPVVGTASSAGQSTPDGDDTSGSNPSSSTSPEAASPSGPVVGTASSAGQPTPDGDNTSMQNEAEMCDNPLDTPGRGSTSKIPSSITPPVSEPLPLGSADKPTLPPSLTTSTTPTAAKLFEDQPHGSREPTTRMGEASTSKDAEVQDKSDSGDDGEDVNMSGGDGEDNGEGECDDEQNVTVVRDSKHREQAKGKKRGRPSQFQGEHAKLLATFLERYRQLVETEEGAEKRRLLGVFWHDVQVAYYERFTWREARGQLEKAWRKASKNEVIKHLNTVALKSYYRNRVKPPVASTNGYWKKVLAPLAKSEGPVPQLTTAWQVFSSLERDRVSAEMLRQDPKGDLSDIAWRNQVARILYENESDDRKQEIAREAERLKVEKLIAFGSAQDKLGLEVNTEMQLSARNRLGEGMLPMLRFLAEQTGLGYITLIAGSPPNEVSDKYEVCVVNWGKTSDAHPRDFTSYDREGFRNNVVKQFTKFMQHAQNQTMSINEAMGNMNFKMFEPDNVDLDGGEAVAESSEGKGKARHIDTSAGPALLPDHNKSSAAQPANSRAKTTTKDDQPLSTPAAPSKMKKTPKPRPKKVQSASASSQTSMDYPEGVTDMLKSMVRAMPAEEMKAYLAKLCGMSPTELEEENSKGASWSQGLASTNPAASKSSSATSTSNSANNSVDNPPKGKEKSTSSSEHSLAAPESSSASPTSNSGNNFVDKGPRKAGSSSSTSTSNSANTSVNKPAKGNEKSPPEPSSTSTTPTSSDAGSDSGVQPAAAALLQDVDRLNWPDWLESAFDKFTSETVGADHTACWEGLLLDWVAFERVMLFATPRTGFSSTLRPDELVYWVKNGRRNRVLVKDEDKDRYVAQWSTWWMHINPAWRERDDNGNLVIGGAGDWDCMRMPGRNGFLNVIGALCALKDVLDMEAWVAQLRDVRWVMGELLRGEIGQSTTAMKRPAAAQSAAEKRSRKKRKT